jgi:dolichyl-phosphate-mannose-protein mannosyltransferase
MTGIRHSAAAPGLAGRLHLAVPGAAVWGWVGPLLVTAFGAWLRFAHLGNPPAMVFDEVFYVPDAFGILRYGAEHNVSSVAASLILGGHTGIFVPGAEFAAHPPFGKIQIAAGEWMFGLNPFGWRFAAALAGSLSVLLLARIARRLTGSTLLGCVAGLLLALDGLELVMSRTAMLDIFVMFWVLAGFGCLLLGHDRGQARASRPGHDGTGRPGTRWSRIPWSRIRWWRVAAGACLGLAGASKWNGLLFLAAFVPVCVASDVSERRAAGRPSWWASAREGAAALVTLALTAATAYLAAWGGWFASASGWDRHYAAAHGVRIPVVSALYSLAEYQREMWSFGSGLRASHSFASQPWTWLTLKQPVQFYYATQPYGVSGCRSLPGCVQQVLAIGTPAVWWASVPALAAVACWWLLRRDWRAGAVLACVAAGWLPWFAFAGRPQYLYYAVSFLPFLILALVLCAALIIGPAAASRARRVTGMLVTAGYAAAVAVNFFYLLPLLTGEVIPRAVWLARLWWPNWV